MKIGAFRYPISFGEECPIVPSFFFFHFTALKRPIIGLSYLESKVTVSFETSVAPDRLLFGRSFLS